MRVIYSVGAEFGGAGFGYIAYSVARHLRQRGVLKKIIALAKGRVEIGPGLISQLGFAGYLIAKSPNQVLRDNVFDIFAALNIEKCDIFHGWSHQSLFSLRNAKSIGALTYIERASTHILTQKRLVLEEYKNFGITKSPIDNSVIDKCLKEFSEADFVCVPSAFARESFLENGVDAKKIVLAPYGVDLERFKPAQKKDDVFRVLFAGLVGFRKGVYYLLEAWLKLNLKRAELLLAGPILAEFKPMFKKYINTPSIKYLGFVRDIVSVYPECSVFVLPSIEEGFGLVALEAMASGIPAIVSTNTGAKDVIDDSQDGFVVQAGEAGALADRLNYLYQHQDAIAPMGKLARQKAEAYPWEKTAKILINDYSKRCA